MVTEKETNLLELFTQAAREVLAEVEIIKRTPAELNIALTRITEKEEKVFLSEPNDIDPELFSLFKQNSNVITKPTKEELSNIITGVTDAFCGVAKTGSVCVTINNNMNSPASMLTRSHIVVVDSKTIVLRPKDVFSEQHLNGEGLKRSFSFITGPSATADMGPLVRGVHGPGELYIIILE